MSAPSLLQRLSLGLALTGGLVAFGIQFTGLHARAASFLQPSWESGVAALPGSTTRRESIVLQGEPTRVLVCRAPDRSPQQVFQRFRRQARQAASAERPFVELDHGDGGVLAWVSETGDRVGVIVEPDPQGGCRYRILETPAPSTGPRTLRLPAGLATPAGLHVVSSAERPDGTGYALLSGEGSLQEVAAQLRTQLEGHGFQISRHAALALGELQRDTDRLTVPFEAQDRRGILVVVAEPDGSGVRVSLTVSEG